jgi:aminoglycoside phosphotransferase (APT) family kinase protein
MPAAEVDIPPGLVRRLLAGQHPDLAALPLEVLANGWDNLSYRLGPDLVVRLPRRAVAAGLVRNEQRWLPVLAPLLPLAIPAPVRCGQPALGYPWPWSVVPFLPGRSAALDRPADLAAAAASMGGFLAALHLPAAADAPANPFRGVPLATRDQAFRQRLESLRGSIDAAAASRVWEQAVAAPRWDRSPVWVHGDLHPANILVRAGAISAVLDFGDITGGDPATDLSVVWMLLPGDCHGRFVAAYEQAGGRPISAADWARAKGWAVGLSLSYLANSADNPLMAGIGQRALDAVLASDGCVP